MIVGAATSGGGAALPWLAVHAALARNGLVDQRYRIVRWIGQGACAAVYEAVDITNSDASVAIKVMNAELVMSPMIRKRFMQEAEAAIHIDSPFVVSVHAVGTLEDNRPYIVMELLDGEDLGRLLDRMTVLDEQRSVELAIHALSGLAHAHSRGVLHRDIKPANLVLVRSSSGDEVLKIVDLGISKLTNVQETPPTESELGLTKTNAILGSPVYMSPEQCRGMKSMDHRSDLYSLGVVLYECLTGKVPHNGENVNEIMFKIALEDAPDPRTHNADLDPKLAAIVMRALQRDVDKRFASASAFREALLEWGAERGARVPPAPSSSRMRTLPTPTSLSPRRVRSLEVTIDDEDDDHVGRAKPDRDSGREALTGPIAMPAAAPPRLLDSLASQPPPADTLRRRKVMAVLGAGALALVLVVVFLVNRAPSSTTAANTSTPPKASEAALSAVATIETPPAKSAPSPSVATSASARPVSSALAAKKVAPVRGASRAGASKKPVAHPAKVAEGEAQAEDTSEGETTTVVDTDEE